MAQADLFSQLNNPRNNRTMSQQAQAAGVSQAQLTRDVQRLLENESAILKVKKKIYDIDVKQHGLFKSLGKMMKNMTKQNDDYLKNRKSVNKTEKEILKIEKELRKERLKGRNADRDRVNMLSRQTEQLRYQARLGRIQNDQMRRALPLGGRLSSAFGAMSKGAKVTSGIIGTISSTLGSISGIFGLILAPIKLMGSLLMRPWQTFLEIQEITGNLAADIGLTNKESYKFKDTFNELAITALDFGGSMQDVATAMQIISSETGRNKFFDVNTMKGLANLAYATGLGMEGATQMAAMFDNMGISLEKGIELTEDARKVASKYNLNNTKMLQTLGAFTKQLNGYDFKNGIAGLTQIVAKAQSLRFDLGSIKGLADNLFDPEGAIEASAQLQVLGGRFSSMGDPFGLMYAAQNAPEQLADSMMNMTKGMAKRGKDGNFFISAADRKSIQLASAALGADANNMINAAIEQGKLADKLQSNPILKQGIFDENQLQALGNLIELKNGQYVIRMPEGYDKLVTAIPSRSEFKRILEERQANENAAIERKSWADRFNLIIQKFMIGFSKPFSKLESIFNDQNLFMKIENIGSMISGQLVPFLDKLFAKDGGLFEMLEGFATKISTVLSEVMGLFSDPNKTFLQKLGEGMGRLWDGIAPAIGAMVQKALGYALIGIAKVTGMKGAQSMGEKLLNGQSSSETSGAFTGQKLQMGGAHQLTNLIGYGGKALAKSGASMGAKGVGFLLKKVPVLGLAISAYDAVNRMMDGDFLGAGLSFTSGLASTVPGWGTAVSAGLDGINMARDVTSVQDGVVTSDGQVIKYPKGELLSIMSPQQNMGGGTGGRMELSGTVKLETPAGSTNLTIEDFKRLGIHLIASTIGHEQDKTSKGYGLNDSKDIKTSLAI